MIHVWALGFLGNDGCTCGYKRRRGKGLGRKFCCAISCLGIIKYPEEFYYFFFSLFTKLHLQSHQCGWTLPATSVTFSYKAKLCSWWVSPDLHRRTSEDVLYRGYTEMTEFWIPTRIYSCTVCFSRLHPTSWSELSFSNNKDHISTAHSIPVYWHYSSVACPRAAHRI